MNLKPNQKISYHCKVFFKYTGFYWKLAPFNLKLGFGPKFKKNVPPFVPYGLHALINLMVITMLLLCMDTNTKTYYIREQGLPTYVYIPKGDTNSHGEEVGLTFVLMFKFSLKALDDFIFIRALGYQIFNYTWNIKLHLIS